MKILIMCPGQFSHGLNSPERGEGRWAQNYARMLAQAGHDVYAASGGFGRHTCTEYGVKLIGQEPTHVKKQGEFDLYFDAAWWEGRVPAGTAKKYVALKWSPENYMYKPFVDDFYLAYPYSVHHFNFSRTDFPNRDKTFALPTMFGNDFCRPNWKADKIFLPGKIGSDRGEAQYHDVLVDFLSKHPVEGTSMDQFRQQFGDKIDFNKEGSRWVNSMPYNEVLEAMSRCRISLPVLNPGAIIEAVFMGVPSIFWEHGGFFNPLGDMLNITIGHNAPPERFTEVAELMMTNEKKYREIVYTMQDYFIGHTYKGAMKYFNLMCETIGLPVEDY